MTPTDTPTSERACCACLHVEYKPKDVWLDAALLTGKGALGQEERWLCRDCGGEFTRSAGLADLEAELAGRENVIQIAISTENSLRAVIGEYRTKLAAAEDAEESTRLRWREDETTWAKNQRKVFDAKVTAEAERDEARERLKDAAANHHQEGGLCVECRQWWPCEIRRLATTDGGS